MTSSMPARLGRLPLRIRLVAGFVVAMVVLLSAAGGFVYWRVEYALDRGLDAELSRATSTIRSLIDQDGQVTTPQAAAATGAGWQVVDRTGQVLDRGGTAPTAPLLSARDLELGGSGTRTVQLGDLLPVAADPSRVRVTMVDDRYLLVAVARGRRDEALRELLLQLTLAGLGALLGAAVVGDALARAALRPVERYRRRAEDIATGAHGLRLDVPLGRDDEVTRLGHTLNDMLTTLERALEHERRFVNDASHELRTPLTMLKSRVQLARRRSRTPAEHEAVLDELSIDVARLVDLAEQLLDLGSSDRWAGRADVNQAVSSVVERRQLSGPDEAQHVVLHLPTGSQIAAIDPLALARVVTNLLENAFLHGRPPVHVRVCAPAERAETDPSWVLLQVEDAGPGMPPDLLAEATGRFTRAPDARARPGSGLGLSLVQEIVTAAGGELRLCHDGTHTAHGPASPFPCSHSPLMTTSVFLPSPEHVELTDPTFLTLDVPTSPG